MGAGAYHAAWPARRASAMMAAVANRWTGLALMLIGGLLTAGATGFPIAAAGRLLSGIGAVLMNILLAKLVADWFVGKEVSTAMAVMLTSWPVGLGVGAATLGGLAATTSWRTAMV